MDVTENSALVALKTAMSFEEAEKLALECAAGAIKNMEYYTAQYVADNKEMRDDFLLAKADDMGLRNHAVLALSRCYLTLLHRRGLVGF